MSGVARSGSGSAVLVSLPHVGVFRGERKIGLKFRTGGRCFRICVVVGCCVGLDGACVRSIPVVLSDVAGPFRIPGSSESLVVVVVGEGGGVRLACGIHLCGLLCFRMWRASGGFVCCCSLGRSEEVAVVDSG